jgi:hypothetical protein
MSELLGVNCVVTLFHVEVSWLHAVYESSVTSEVLYLALMETEAGKRRY